MNTITMAGITWEEEVDDRAFSLVPANPWRRPTFKPSTDLATDVSISAAVLDEHVPDWPVRITRPLNMVSGRFCVLGQVFAAGESDISCSYAQGLEFLRRIGHQPRPLVFTDERARPHWEAEIRWRLS